MNRSYLTEMDVIVLDLLEKELGQSRTTDIRTLRFASNLLLVLGGQRLAYLFSVREAVTSIVQALTPPLTIISLSKLDTLIVLEENKERVLAMLEESSSPDYHFSLALVLGYAYQGRDWRGGDRYGVNYFVSFGRIECQLYAFMVPRTSYDLPCRTKIFEDLCKYNATLNKHGIEVCVESWPRE